MPGLSAVGAGGGLRQVQMENIHPLRLRILMEIERTGSISAAAESCGIGQPSASMHLRTLEAATGQKLVTRTGRGSSLTPGITGVWRAGCAWKFPEGRPSWSVICAPNAARS